MKIKLFILGLSAVAFACGEHETNSSEANSVVESDNIEDHQVETHSNEEVESDNIQWENPTERFLSSGDKDAQFSHIDYQRYRWYENGELIKEGKMNTERGFMDDENATVYVMDWDEEPSIQKLLVRTSNGEDLKLYDGNRTEIPGYTFK